MNKGNTGGDHDDRGSDGREGQQGDDYHNRVAGVDGNLQLGDSDAILFQFLHSDTRYPQAVARAHDQPLASFGGNGSQVAYNHTGRDWLVNLFLQDLAEGFRADSGFVPRVDVLLSMTWQSLPGSQVGANFNAPNGNVSAGNDTNGRPLFGQSTALLPNINAPSRQAEFAVRFQF